MHEVPFQLLGISLKLQTDDDPERLHKAISYLATRIQEVRDSYGIQKPLELALIVGLKLSEEILSVGTLPDHDLDRWTKTLIDRIDEVL